MTTASVNPPQPGDFFLVPMGGKLGKSIQFGQFLNGDGFRPVQHAGIYLGYGKTIEAMPGGAIVGMIRKYDRGPIVWSTGLFDLTLTQRREIVMHAEGFKDIPYSFLDYAALGLHRFGIPAPRLSKYIDSTGHMICSQLVDKAYEMSEVRLFNDGRWPGDVTPGDLYNLVEDTRIYRRAQGI